MVARPVHVQMGSMTFSHTDIDEAALSMSYPFDSEERDYDAFVRHVFLDRRDVPQIESAETQEGSFDESMVTLQTSAQLPLLNFDASERQFIGVDETNSAILGMLSLDVRKWSFLPHPLYVLNKPFMLNREWPRA